MKFTTNKDTFTEAKAFDTLRYGMELARTQIQTERCKAAIEAIKEMRSCKILTDEEAGKSLVEVMGLLGFDVNY